LKHIKDHPWVEELPCLKLLLEYVLSPEHTRYLGFYQQLNAMFEAHTAIYLSVYLECKQPGREVMFLRALHIYHSSASLYADIWFFFTGIEVRLPGTERESLRRLVCRVVVDYVYRSWSEKSCQYRTTEAREPRAREASGKFKTIDALRIGGWVLWKMIRMAKEREMFEDHRSMLEGLHLLRQQKKDVVYNDITRFLLLIENKELTFPTMPFADLVAEVRDVIHVEFQKKATAQQTEDAINTILGMNALSDRWSQLIGDVLESSQSESTAPSLEVLQLYWRCAVRSLVHSHTKGVLKLRNDNLKLSGTDRKMLKAKIADSSKQKSEADCTRSA
jgi:hypothetical protein